MNAKLTIFTPTYNRRKSLEKLYKSLIIQTNKNFVWNIIDDGSKDDTEGIVQKFMKEGKIEIIYEKRVNGGKYSALISAMKNCKTELFLCIDSDDFVTCDCVEYLLTKWEKDKKKQKVIGIVTPRSDKNGKSVCRNYPDQKKVKFCQLQDLYCIKGETLIMLRTSYIKQFEYPIFNDEKFCSEELIYNLYDEKYYVITYNKALCIMEYLEDGLTRNLMKNWLSSPNATLKLLKDRYILNYELPFICRVKRKCKAVIFQTCFFYKLNKPILKNVSNPFLAIVLFPIAYIVYRRRFNDVSKI